MIIKTNVSELTKDDIVSILSIGLEDSFWAVVNDCTDNYKNAKGDTIEDKLADILLNGKEITIYDSYENEDHTINITQFVQGLQQFFDNGGNSNIEKWDGIDGDNALQYITFGEVIYG